MPCGVTSWDGARWDRTGTSSSLLALALAVLAVVLGERMRVESAECSHRALVLAMLAPLTVLWSLISERRLV